MARQSSELSPVLRRLVDPSAYIERFDRHRHGRVVIACRVSAYKQKWKQTLERHVAELTRRMERRGVEVVGVVRHVGSGADPSWLWEAVALAEANGAAIVAMSTDRLIRSPRYHSADRPDAVAGRDDLERLQWWTEGVTLATVLHPDLHPAKVRAHRVKCGQRATGRRGGRPTASRPGYKKQWREKMLRQVLKLRARGLSYRAIAGWTDVPESSVRRWLKEPP